MRILLLLVVLAGVAGADKKAPSPKAAKAANKTAADRAIAKLKLKVIQLTGVPAEVQEVSDDVAFVANIVANNEPMFVVDANKNVFRVVRRMNPIGRVKENVCHAGPAPRIQIKRTRYDVPKGHTFKGEIEVTYDAYVIDEQNTCR
jgi:hypothetical protein